MQDDTKTIAKLAIRKQVIEAEDPILVYTMKEEAPQLKPGIKVAPYTEQDGDGYNACLLYFAGENGCCFYKHCVRKGCKSADLARVIAEYGQSTAMINCPNIKTKPLIAELNLN